MCLRGQYCGERPRGTIACFSFLSFSKILHRLIIIIKWKPLGYNHFQWETALITQARLLIKMPSSNPKNIMINFYCRTFKMQSTYQHIQATVEFRNCNFSMCCSNTIFWWKRTANTHGWWMRSLVLLTSSMPPQLVLFGLISHQFNCDFLGEFCCQPAVFDLQTINKIKDVLLYVSLFNIRAIVKWTPADQ